MNCRASLPLLDLIDAAPRARRQRCSMPQGAQFDLLDSPGLHPLTLRQVDGHYEVEAEPSKRPAGCPHCSALGRRLYVHDLRLKHVTDAPVRRKHVVIILHLRRYKCQECLKVTLPLVEGIDLHSRMTNRLRELIEMEALRYDRTFRAIAAEMGVTEKTVRQIFTKLMNRSARAWRFEAPYCLGIDEVYIEGVARCVLTDPLNRKVINLLKKRDMLTLRRHLLQIKHPERIGVIVIDMWRAYRDEALKRFPNAIIVIDKYHLLRLATAAVISVHRRLRRQDKSLRLPKIYLLRKRKHKLPKDKLRELEQRLEQLPELKEAHQLREEIFNYWNCEHRVEAEQRVDEWILKLPAYLRSDFEELLSALKNWRQEIFNYFDYRYTNAFTESFNNIIKSMQRNGRGYTFEVTRAKLLYGGKFSITTATALSGAATTTGRRAKRRKRVQRSDAPPNPQANVQQLKQLRLAEDEFTELMRSPQGFVERFKHLAQQLDLTF